MEFDGEDDLIQTGIAASELIGLEALTIATRFKWMGDDFDGGPQEQGILSNAKSGNSQLDFGIDYEWPGGDRRIHLAWADVSTLGSNAMQHSLLDAIAIQPDIWYDVVVTLSSDAVKWYLDGVLVEQDAVVFAELGQQSTAVPNLRIGKANEIYDTHYGGVLDDLQLYTRALTAEEAQGLYACGAAHDSTGLIGHWSFEEGVGSITLDDSPAGHNGDIVGAQFTSDTPESPCTGCSATDTLQVALHHGGCFCGEGTEWDEDTQQCLAVDSGPTPSCGEGTVWDPVAEECIVAIPTDTDFDGCVTAGDVLNLLATFGTCPPIPEWPDESNSPWVCGDSLAHQGYDYATVQIGGQCWFAENLRATESANGESLEAGTPSTWPGYQNGTGAWAYPNNHPLEEVVFGLLYNWFATVQGDGICPSGWHLPSDEEWKDMETHLGIPGSELDSFGWHGANQGTELKAVAEWDGTDMHGFAALPSGGMHADQGHAGSFGSEVWFWTSTTLPADSGKAMFRSFSSGESRVNRHHTFKNHGASVRCLKD